MGDERDCGDNSCKYATKKTGMRTNGGCSCDECSECGRSVPTPPVFPHHKHRDWCSKAPSPPPPTLAEACEVIEALLEVLADCDARWGYSVGKASAFLERVKGRHG